MTTNPRHLAFVARVLRVSPRVLLLSAALLVLIHSPLRGQATLAIAFNNIELSSLQYNGTQFLSYGDVRLNEVAFQNADGSVSYGSTASTVAIDPIGGTQTRTYQWGSIVTGYLVSGNTLGLTITVNNRSTLPIQTIWINPLALNFPTAVQEFDGTTPLVQNTRGQPVVQSMTFNTGVIALADDDVALPLMLGFPWSLNSPTNTAFPLDINTGVISMYPNSYPNIQRPIAAGASDQYHISLRFGAPGSTTLTLAPDVYQAFGQAFPAQLSWPDRRPIGQLILGTSGTNWATNPRGWLLDPTIDVTTAVGVAALKTRILGWAQGAVSILQSMNAQGMITWDIEGEQFSQPTSYVCDPQAFAETAPEMAGIADAYFQIFQNAGLRVGVCLRPQNFVLAPDLSSAQQEVVTDPTQVTQLLIAKAAYAQNRWGATLFYIDSNVNSYTDPNPIDPAIIQSLQRAFPNSLFIPEHSLTQYYAYSAPIKQLNQGYTSTSPTARFTYPSGFTMLYTPNGPVQQDFNTLVTSVQQGDSLMFRAWFDDQPDNQTVQSIYQTAGGSISAVVNPQSVTLAAGQSQQFGGSIIGTSNQQVTWSTIPAVGSITSSGLYTAPAAIPANLNISIVATSVSNPAKSGTAYVSLTAPQPASITAIAGTPQSASLGSVFPAPFQATVKDSTGKPMSGLSVTFTAPVTGPSGAFSGSTTAVSITNSSGVASTLSFTANTQAGSYGITASVSGLSASATFLCTNSGLTGGSLQGTSTSSPSVANLSSEGNVDWVHWGGTEGLDRDAGVTAQISNYSIVGSGTVFNYGNDPRPLSWNDGAPASSSTSNTTGLYILGAGQGFSFLAPASTTPRTLVVYVGGWNSSGTLTAHLTDGSAPDFSSTTPAVNVQFDQNYTITYASASTAASLIITWKMTSGAGNVTLNGAALSLNNGSFNSTPSAINAMAGTPQSAMVDTGFSTPLQVLVTNSSGVPVNGATVTFTAPTTGPSASFSGLATAETFTGANGVAMAPVLVANGQSGTYMVMASVAGVAKPASFSLTNLASVTTTGTGSLQGAVTMLPTAVNLTTEGTSDWIHFGDAETNRKASVVAQLSAYSMLGSAIGLEYYNDPRVIRWTDGNPILSSPNNHNGVYVAKIGNGFTLTASADTSVRTLTIHVGGWNSSGRFTAHLSDGSALDFTDVSPSYGNQYDRNYTLTYQAASAGQTLTVAWVVNSGTGNVSLSAAALH